jgi:invasion protein IalB
MAVVASLASPPLARAQDATVGGWSVRCDAPTCRASRSSASGLQALLVGRFETGDGVAVGLSAPGAIVDRDRPMTLRVDGKRIADLAPKSGFAPFERVDAFWVVDAGLARAVVEALPRAKSLRFEYIDVTGAPHDADIDTAGFAEVLAWTDRQLGRATAKAVGVAPRGLAPAPDPGRAELVIRMGTPPRLLAKHIAASDCEAPNSPLLRTFKPVIGVLSSTAILYSIPCAASAGNVSYRLWVVESGEIGGITAQYFALLDPVYGWKGTDLLQNVTYDDKATRLVATLRTGAGCGGRGVWRWKKWAFAMEEYRLATDCVEGRDPATWPEVWPKN